MFGDVEKQLDDLMGKWEDLKKNLEQQKREADKTLDESKQGECEKCGHTLTDGGQCPVCDLGDEEERTSHTLYEGLSFQEGDVLEYSGLFGGSYTSRVTKIEGSKMWVDTSWTAEESGEEVHDEDTFFIVKDDEGNDCIEVYHYQGEVGRVYPPRKNLKEDTHYTITVTPISRISTDGFQVVVTNGEEEVEKKEYLYGWTASYSRKFADSGKPFTGDIIKKYCNKYNVPTSEIKFIKGTNTFTGKEISDDAFNSVKNSINEMYWFDDKEKMSKAEQLLDELIKDGWNIYNDRDTGSAYYTIVCRRGEDGKGEFKAVKYGRNVESEVIDITYKQAIGSEPLDSFHALRRHLGRMLLPEAMSGKDAIEMLKIAKEIGIHNGEDLIRFYKDHPAADEDKLATIQAYRNELGPDFKLEEGTRVSFDLDGKNYRGTYRGQSTTNPDMADVEMDDDCYENPDPYGRYINRRPIYNRHEDRYIKDGKFFIPRSELKFLDENRRTRTVERSIDEIAELLGGYEFMQNTIKYIIDGHPGVEDDNETIAEMIFDSETPVSYEELLSLVEYLNN